MTISSTLTQRRYACNGVTTVFAVLFQFAAGGLTVRLIDDVAFAASGDIDASSVLLAEGPNYTLSGDPGSGSAQVTTVTAYPAGKTVGFDRTTPREQLLHYTPNDGFPAESHEQGLDRQMMIAQEQDAQASRALRFPANENGQTLPVPAQRANKWLKADGDGNLLFDSGLPADASNFIQVQSSAARNFQIRDGLLKRWVSADYSSLDVRRFGYFGDGQSHPLSDIYGDDLARAQVDFPLADSLTCEMDSLAFQSASYAAAVRGGGIIHVPDSAPIFNRVISIFTPHTAFRTSGTQSCRVSRYGDYGPTFRISYPTAFVENAGLHGFLLDDPGQQMTLKNSPYHIEADGVAVLGLRDIVMNGGTGLASIRGCGRVLIDGQFVINFPPGPATATIDGQTYYRRGMFVGPSQNTTPGIAGLQCSNFRMLAPDFNLRDGDDFRFYIGLDATAIDGGWIMASHIEGGVYADYRFRRETIAPLGNIHVVGIMSDICANNGIVIDGAAYPVGRMEISGNISADLQGSDNGVGLLVIGQGIDDLKSDIGLEGFKGHAVHIQAGTIGNYRLNTANIKRGGGNGNAITIEGGTVIDISGGIIDGRKDDGSSGGFIAGLYTGPLAGRVTSAGLDVYHCAGDGVFIDGTDGVSVTGGRSEANGGYGARIRIASNHVRLSIATKGNTAGTIHNEMTGDGTSGPYYSVDMGAAWA